MHYCNSRENFAPFNFFFNVSWLKICFWLVFGCVWVVFITSFHYLYFQDIFMYAIFILSINYLYFYDLTNVFSVVFFGKNNKIIGIKINTIKITFILLYLYLAKVQHLHMQVLFHTNTLKNQREIGIVVLTKRSSDNSYSLAIDLQ